MLVMAHSKAGPAHLTLVYGYRDQTSARNVVTFLTGRGPLGEDNVTFCSQVLFYPLTQTPLLLFLQEVQLVPPPPYPPFLGLCTYLG